MPEWIDRLLKVAMLLISPLLFFILCEITVRIVSPQIHGWDGDDPNGTDPVLERIMLPNMATGYVAVDGRRISFHTNSQGFRGKSEYGRKDSTLFRIIGLGDSFTNGSGVNDDETYLQVMEDRINLHYDRKQVEVINMGVASYGTIKERIFFEREGLKMQPDLVTVGFLPNDLWDNIGWLERQTGKQKAPEAKSYDDISPLSPLIGIVYQLKARSHFIIWLGKKVMSVPGIYGFAYKKRPDKFDFTSSENEEQIKAAYAVVHSELSRIGELCDSIGAKMAVISIPLCYQMVTGLDDSGDIRYLDKLLSSSCEELGIEFVSLLDTLRSATEQHSCYFPMDGHLNRLGQKVAGEYVANWIVSKEWITYPYRMDNNEYGN